MMEAPIPKTAIDPFFATNNEPVSAGRHALVVTPSTTTDLPHVTGSLLVTVTTSGATVSVICADDLDSGAVTITFPVGVFQLYMQVRRVTAVSGAASVVALWNQ